MHQDTQAAYDEYTPILIVGGGAVGLSMALFLQHQQIPFIMVERHAGTTLLPRARGVHFRTMELYREVGLEQQIQAKGATTLKQGRFGGLRIGSTLADSENQEIQVGKVNMAGIVGSKEISPSSFCFCPQDEIEPILRATALARGGDLRFSTELITFEQDEQGVTSTLLERTSGVRRTVRSDYLIATDGARSPIREALHITTSGKGALETYLNIYFLADLAELVRDRTFSQCWIENADVRGLFLTLNNADRWAFHLAYDPAKGEKPEDFPEERCVELLRKAIGVPDIAIEIKSIGSWESAMRVADSYQQGRIFLAGDSAHLMPPWGGHGANTGIADAHNLAWKLAAVLRKEAAPTLLETYEAERRPIGYRASQESALRTNIYTRYGIPTSTNAEDLKQLGNPFFLIVGYHYHSAAISEVDGLKEPENAESALTGQPGSRLPHVQLQHNDQCISTLDLVGTQWALLAARDGEAWCEAARQFASTNQIKLAAYRIGDTGKLQDKDNQWLTATGLETNGALLVRPDGFVAWRSTSTTPVGYATLEQVLKNLLGYATTTPSV